MVFDVATCRPEWAISRFGHLPALLVSKNGRGVKNQYRKIRRELRRSLWSRFVADFPKKSAKNQKFQIDFRCLLPCGHRPPWTAMGHTLDSRLSRDESQENSDPRWPSLSLLPRPPTGEAAAAAPRRERRERCDARVGRDFFDDKNVIFFKNLLGRPSWGSGGGLFGHFRL